MTAVMPMTSASCELELLISTSEHAVTINSNSRTQIVLHIWCFITIILKSYSVAVCIVHPAGTTPLQVAAEFLTRIPEDDTLYNIDATH